MLYLIDKPHAKIGLRTARANPDPTVVLVQDGVVLEPDIDAPIYAVEEDCEVRGVDLPPAIEPVTYARLVELIFESEVKTFV
ncbi:MAG: hypothetical protein ACOCTH_03700 [Halodesulfurarchaeum sp.]